MDSSFSLVPRFATQPPGTEAAEFSAVNQLRHEDMLIEQRVDPSFSVLAYDCCSWCGPVSRISFDGVTEVVGIEDDMDLSAPLFRKGSTEEAQALRVPVGHTAFCIVTNHGYGADGPKVFVVAQAVRVELGAQARVGC